MRDGAFLTNVLLKFSTVLLKVLLGNNPSGLTSSFPQKGHSKFPFFELIRASLMQSSHADSIQQGIRTAFSKICRQRGQTSSVGTLGDGVDWVEESVAGVGRTE